MVNAAIKAETPKGAALAAEALPFIIDQPTIEQIQLAVEGIYQLFDKYSGRPATGYRDTGFDTILSGNTLEFSMAVDAMAQSARNIINL